MNASLYWIRCKDHTDMFSQGYIGVSKNVQRRWEDHKKGNSNNKYLINAIKKYGWDNLIKQIIVIGEEAYCYELESKIRLSNKIGWNLVSGGNNPPNQTGKKRSKEYILKRSGKNHPYFKNGNILQGSKNPNFKGKIVATCMKTGKQKILAGAKDIILAGFTTTHVYKCVNGKSKLHKNHKFIREV